MPNDEQLAALARLIADTADHEIDCAEMVTRVADYLRARRGGAALDSHLQAVAQHLRICPECREELAALARAEGLDPRMMLGE